MYNFEFTRVNNRDKFARLLSKGYFAGHMGDPWVRFNQMIDKYGEESALLLSKTCMTYATVEYFSGLENAKEIKDEGED